MSGDEIVITGVSGILPNSDNVEIFQKNLLNKKDCLTSRDPMWITGDFKIPEKDGKVEGRNEFDAQFFRIFKKNVENMDAITRKLLECTYESICDAGINPRSLKGKKVAVFMAKGLGEVDLIEEYIPDQYTVQGYAKAMFANRISFFLGLQGPSAVIHSMNTASGTALEKAYLAIKNGEVESAIVGGGNITFYPHISFQLLQLGLLSPDGLTKSFDESSNGYSRSEAIVVFFLQKARDAKRIYVEIKNVHCSNGPSYERLSVLYPTCEFQKDVMKQTLKECDISAKEITFVEADGLGIKEADAEEIKAIDQVYNYDRKTPLLIGSVKSNVGSCNGADTLISILKVITMMETGLIPPNLHYQRPSDKLSAIHEGRIQVVTKPTPWNGEYVAVNTTGIGGGFATVILKAYRKRDESKPQPICNLPKLIMVSGVNEEAVNTILDHMESKPFSAEMFQLINEVFEVENVSHLYRGYALLHPEDTTAPTSREIHFDSGLKKEIWYVFSGMGSQWAGMGKSLMKLPFFMKSVLKCNAVLKPHEIDIIDILTSDDPKIFNNIINSFVGIATIQVCLVDLLTHLGIKPDYMIGHSVGELGCAYADGCLTAEQTVLNAYFRGLASVETETPKGLMAAVGLGYKDVKLLCPPDIDVACHNSADSSTISGPIDSVKKFIVNLQAKGIFAKEVPTCNIAYHSRYIAQVGVKLIKYLEKILPDSKARSQRWLSTSVPRNEWHTAKAQLSSAEYYTNNLLNSVLFEEVTMMIPKDATTIEIAPHGLLQAILKRCLPETVVNLSLTKRGHHNNMEIVMGAIGKLYINSGYRAEISKLYTNVNYPVSRGTPSISSLIKWDHSENWSRYVRRLFWLNPGVHEKVFSIDLNNEAWSFLKGHMLGTKNILPCSLYLKLVYSTLETFDASNSTIIFENVTIYENPCISEDLFKLTVMIQTGSGNFELTMDGLLLCVGTLSKIDSIDQNQMIKENVFHGSQEELESNEIYKQLLLQGYHYSGPFKTICKFNPIQSFGYIFHQEDWSMFLEGMFQMWMIQNYTKYMSVPIKIQKIIFDTQSYKLLPKHLKAIPVSINAQSNLICSYGIELCGIELSTIKQNLNHDCINIREMKLILNSDETAILPTEFAEVVLQLLIQNELKNNIIEFIKEESDVLEETQTFWLTVFNELPQSQLKFEVISSSSVQSEKRKATALQVFFDTKTLTKANLAHTFQEGDFLLFILNSQDENKVSNIMKLFDLGIILNKSPVKNQRAVLFRKNRLLRNTCILESTDDFILTDEMKAKINSSERIILSTKCSFRPNELFELLSEEQIKDKVRYFEILDSKAPKLALDDPFYQSQVKLDLKFNILTPERKWGFRSLVPVVTKSYTADNTIAFQTRPGDLNSFDWAEQSCDNFDNSMIKVEYASINQFDVLLASGELNIFSNDKYNGSKRIKKAIKTFGLEYSGTNAKGDHIMGLTKNGTICSYTSSDSELTWEVPNGWTLEEAATVPLAYTSAYMALYVRGEIEKQSSVFIYDGSCAIGQAVITLALNEDLQVFTTYRTEKDKELLKLHYPSLNDNQLFCLKESFENDFLFSTRGKKVDFVVYNSYDMNGFEPCLKCVKDEVGRFTIIGQLQESFRKSVGMYAFLNHFAMYSIIPENLVDADIDTKKLLSSLIKDGLKNEVIKPIFSNLYLKNNLSRGFIDAKHKALFGKIVINVSQTESHFGALATPRFSCKKNRTYLLLINSWNNLFGIELINFLIEYGAKDIFVLSASENTPKTLYTYNLKIWQENNARVVFQDNIDLSKHCNVNAYLCKILKCNAIHAIFDIQRMENLGNSTFPQYLITRTVFEESNKICNTQHNFIIFTTLQNSDNEMNTYLFNNSNLITLCDRKLNDNISARLILWSAIEEIAINSNSSNTMNLTISQCINKLDSLLALPYENVFVSKNLISPSDIKVKGVYKKLKKLR